MHIIDFKGSFSAEINEDYLDEYKEMIEKTIGETIYYLKNVYAKHKGTGEEVKVPVWVYNLKCEVNSGDD